MPLDSLIELTQEGPNAVLTLNRPPANAISTDLVRALDERLDEVETANPRALIVTGAGERFFSAGLDLLELYPLDHDALRDFSAAFVSTFLRVYRLPIPVVMAINGHAIAGGAILALCGDKRICADGDPLFGLNEVQVGLPLPVSLFAIVRGAVGGANTAEVTLEGRNYSPEDALARGLLHELVDSTQLQERAREVADQLGKIPARAFVRMKELVHREVEDRIAADAAAAEPDPFVDIWFDEETRRAMGTIYERLKGGNPSSGT